MEPTRKKITLEDTTPPETGIWWTKGPEEIGPAMVTVMRHLETAMESRRNQSRRLVQLHKGQILTNNQYDSAQPRERNEMLHPAWNVVQSVVNTAASVVTRNRVRVVFQTSGTDYEMQEMAKSAELFVAGVFAGNKLYEHIDQLWFLDGGVPGLGQVLAEADESEDRNIILSRIISDELIFNEFEAATNNGVPRQLGYVRWRSPWDAIARYCSVPGDDKGNEERRKAIEACPRYELPVPNQPGKHIPLIPIYTAWFLPSYRGALDGRRVVAIPGTLPGCTLRQKVWKHTRFPIAFFQVERSSAGLWGIGLAERVEGFQYRLHELNQYIEEAARMGSCGRWFRETGSNVNPAHLTNEYGGVVDFTGKRPEFEVIDGIPRDLLQERDTTYAQAFKEVGMSEWSANGVQPDNIESGEGLQQLREQEQGRALPCGQNWEAAHVDLAECVIIAAVDAQDEEEEKGKDGKRGKKPTRDISVSVVDPDGDGMRKVKFSQFAALLSDPDSYAIKPYPTSIMPTTPTAKFDWLEKRLKAGTIDRPTFEALSEMPDTMAEQSVILAGIKAVRFAITNIQKKGAVGYEPPDPAMPLQAGARLAHAKYLQGLRTGMDEERLYLLLTWRDEAERMLKAAQTPTPTAPAAATSAALVGAPVPDPALAPTADPNAAPAIAGEVSVGMPDPGAVGVTEGLGADPAMAADAALPVG